MKIVFWVSFSFIFYTYIGYPLVLLAWAKIKPKPVDKKYIEPTVSIIIAAYNEEKYIGPKIENCFSLSYPREKLQIIVVSDGSNDGTNEIVRRSQSEVIQFYSYAERKGKAYALNLGISKAKGDIIFFTDARQILQEDCLKELVANLHDQSVAVVSGELVLLNGKGNGTNKGIGIYWKIEKWMRKKESEINSVLGATGAVYACRRDMVRPIPGGTILDDVLIPFRCILQGYRSVFESKAIAYDKVSEDLEKEFRRKIRTLSGNYQLLELEPDLLNPLRNAVFFQFASHKLARLAVPFAMIVLFISNIFLNSEPYLIFLYLQLGFYGLSLASRWIPNNCLGRIMQAFYMIFMMNLAAFLSFFKYLFSPKNIPWEKTN